MENGLADCQQNAGGNSGADYACHIGTHSVHQQEVAGILCLADLLRNTSGHRYGGHTGRTDQRVYLAAGYLVHNLAEQHAAGGTAGESKQTKNNDQSGAGAEEYLAGSGGADGNA